jgi:multimeric flavodoxin WrbA
MLELVLHHLSDEGVDGEIVRLAGHAIRPGVKSDEGDGDEWPSIRARILDVDILIVGTPNWLGQPSSVVHV